VSVKAPRITPYGDSALLVQYNAEGFSTLINNKVYQLSGALREQPLWQDLVPGYDSLLCSFDMAAISLEDAKRKIEDTLLHLPKTKTVAGKLIEIPVVYGGSYGPDMAAIKKSSGLTQSQIIEIHSEAPYKVCMMGFIPGFCFLSEIPAVLQHPRHSSGGWQIIGRTPHKLFDKTREKPFLLEAGDRLKFIPSSKAIFS